MSLVDIQTKKIFEYLAEHFQFHTAILYGSRVSANHSNDSDFDFLLIKNKGPRERKIIYLDEFCIDLIVDNEASLDRVENYLYLYECKVLKDDKGLGQKQVAKIQKFLKERPNPMPLDRIEQRKKQTADFIKYIKKESVLGNYRRHWLLFNLLPTYFELRQMHFLGDKHALDWLQKNDVESFRLFERAFEPGASLGDLQLLNTKVFHA